MKMTQEKNNDLKRLIEQYSLRLIIDMFEGHKFALKIFFYYLKI